MRGASRDDSFPIAVRRAATLDIAAKNGIRRGQRAAYRPNELAFRESTVRNCRSVFIALLVSTMLLAAAQAGEVTEDVKPCLWRTTTAVQTYDTMPLEVYFESMPAGMRAQTKLRWKTLHDRISLPPV